MPSRRGLLIQPNGDHEFRDISGYRDIAAAVGGNFDWTAPGSVTYYCYEYALFERPRNPVATALYMVTHETTDQLCGPVLVMGPPVDEDDSDVPEEFVQRFLRAKEALGQDEIDRLAVPLTPEQQMDIQMQMIAAQGKAREALDQGKSVDFGGIQLGIDHPAPSDPTVEEIGDLMNTLFGEHTDGNRRQGRKR